MELQFDKTLCTCLQAGQTQVQAQEQTQEVRLPEGMPDITQRGNIGSEIMGIRKLRRFFFKSLSRMPLSPMMWVQTIKGKTAGNMQSSQRV